MISEQQILGMDFDGVIADSILECAVSGINGYSKYLGKTNFITSPNDIDNHIIEQFRKMRPLIRTGEDYVYLFQAIDTNINISNQHGFDSFKRKYIDRLEKYENCFKSARDWLLIYHFNEWFSLNPLYDGMQQFLTNNCNKVRIISTKSKKYILEILNYHNIAITKSNVYSTTINNSKSDIIKTIIETEDIVPQDFYFVDDHVGILKEISKLKVNCMLAGWGYNDDQLKGSNTNRYIENIQLDKFYNRFTVI